MTTKFVFWPHTRNRQIASFRLRCLNVIEQLRHEVNIGLYPTSEIPEKIILSKRYDEQSISHVLALKEKYGLKVYLDLCDNHFYYDSHNIVAVERAELLRRAILAVNGVIVSSEYLKQIVLSEVPSVKSIVVIDDVVDLPVKPSFVDLLLNPCGYFFLQFIKYRLNKRSDSLRLVWFGNHSGGFADGGMDSLIEIIPILNKYARFITLTVISNSRAHYDELSKGFEFQSYYAPWNNLLSSKMLALHDVAVIPIKKNPFNLAKTSNRVATSLLSGLHVIAGSIPSYKEFEEYIYFDDYQAALDALISSRTRVDGDWRSFFQKKNHEVVEKWKLYLSESDSR